MKNSKKNKYIEQPVYPGGDKALLAYIKSEVNHPANSPSGVVKIRIYFNHKGDVFHTEIIKSLDHACDREAERVCKTLKFITPKVRDYKVRYQRVLQIKFSAPKPKVNQSVQVTYNVTAGKSKIQTNKADSYSYTINLKKAIT